MQQLIPIIIWAVQEAIKYEPAIAEELKSLFSKTDATEADWLALQAKYQRKTYESVVKDSGLIVSDPPTMES